MTHKEQHLNRYFKEIISHGKYGKIWLDEAYKDLRGQGVENWKNLARNRDKWLNIVMANKTLRQ